MNNTDRKGGRGGCADLRAARKEALMERADVLIASGHPLSGGDRRAALEARGELQGETREEALQALQDELAHLSAKAKVRKCLDAQVEERLRAQEQEFYDELRLEILRGHAGPENAATLGKYAKLVSMDAVGLTEQAYRVARPQTLSQIVGQQDALRALTACLCSPFPQHVLLYGPPGVGKTSAARLALQAARAARYTPFAESAPFVEADGSTLRYDPHEAVNPLLGSVHDPIYQGARRELAGFGIPEPKLGMVSEAHGGVLFIDEIGEMEPALQARLLKVLEDKRVRFDSSYFDQEDPQVPAYIKKLFADGAPADFILVGATTRSPSEMPAALRSRCAEIVFRPLDHDNLLEITRGAAERMGIDLTPKAADIIASSALDGRECVRLITAAQGIACSQPARKPVIGAKEARQAVTLQIHPLGVAVCGQAQVGQIHMLGVSGRRGCVLRMEAVAVPGSGSFWFNSAAGSLARDAAHNACVALRAGGFTMQEVDIFLNITGGGNVDGPSAGLAMALVMLSCLTGKKLRQDIAVTGEISLRGDILPVGGITEKLTAARRMGARAVLLPFQAGSAQEDTLPVSNLWEAADAALVEGWPV